MIKLSAVGALVHAGFVYSMLSFYLVTEHEKGGLKDGFDQGPVFKGK